VLSTAIEDGWTVAKECNGLAAALCSRQTMGFNTEKAVTLSVATIVEEALLKNKALLVVVFVTRQGLRRSRGTGNSEGACRVVSRPDEKEQTRDAEREGLV